MTPVLMAVCLLAGFALGWFTKRQRLGLLAENNHWVGEEIEALKGADLDADVAAERSLRLSGEQPAVEPIEVEPFMADSGYQPPQRFDDAELLGPDQLAEMREQAETQPNVGPCAECGTDAAVCTQLILGEGLGGCCGTCASGRYTHPVRPDPRLIHLNAERQALNEQAGDPWDFIGIRSEGSPPIRMTGERDTDAQDRELSEVFHIAPDGYCPVEGHHTTVGRRAYMDWLTWCSCGWEAESTNQAEANELYAQHQAQISGGGCPWAECPHPDRCDTGCRWGEEANQWADAIHAEDDGPETLPRVLPEGRID